MLVQDFDVKADALLGGKGIHVAADGVDLAGNVLGGAVLGAFEDHVLDEVGDPIPLRVFVAGTGLYPYAHRDRANMLHLLGDHGETVGQYLALDVPDVFHHRVVPAGPGTSKLAQSPPIVTQGRGVCLRTLRFYYQ